MADRTDIDALLVGALYGELTPADEARLAAHLEAHPADRTALSDLTRTRDAVRERRILAEQAEPPQAISALLLQEASRRAPRPPSRDPDSLSWFQRLFRSTLVAHPAMSAAATLVLVVGVGGTLYLRGDAKFAESERPAMTSAAATTAASAPPVVPQEIETSTDEAKAVDGPAAAQPASPPRAVAPGGPGAGSYRVDVDQVGDGKSAVARTAATEPSDPPAPRAEAAAEFAAEPARKELATAGRGDDAVNQRPVAPAPSKPRGIELRSPEPQPKELPERDSARAARDRNLYDAAAAGSPPAANNAAASSGSGPGDVPSGSPPPPPPAPAAAAPSPAESKSVLLRNAKRAPAANAAPSDDDLAPAPPRNAAKPMAKAALPDSGKSAKRAAPSAGNFAPGAPAPNAAGNASSNAALPPAAQDRRAGNAGNNLLNNDKAVSDPAVLDWARKQRDQVISLVAANNCRGAAAAAVEIYRRAPDYYAANIATDRAIRPCLAYVNSERERDDRNRAVRNNSNNDAPANAAPPVRR